VQGVSCRLAGREDAVFGDELNTLAQQATGSTSSASSSSGVVVRLVARDGLAAEELLQQLQQAMQKHAGSVQKAASLVKEPFLPVAEQTTCKSACSSVVC
jgi:urease accessory protein UreH